MIGEHLRQLDRVHFPCRLAGGDRVHCLCHVSHRGNWITRPDGLGVGCGWEHFAKRIAVRGWIKVGSGINWRAAGERPRLDRATRTAKGYWS